MATTPWNPSYRGTSRLQYRPLGRTGLDVSEIGFGTWGIGGPVDGVPAYGPADDEESAEALRMAYELGVNLYDTSDLYGAGHSEKVLGETFKDARSNILIATKVGMSAVGGVREFSPENIKRSLADSLKRLGTDYVDLYQLHGPTMDELQSNPEILATMDSLCREGSIRAFGVSVNSPGDGLVAVNKLGVGCIQVNFNLVDQRALVNGLLSLCQEKQVGVIIRTPLCFGFLTGAYGSDTKFSAGDHRSDWPETQREVWAEAGQRFAGAIGQDGQKQTEAQVALRYCLSYSGVSTAIPGMLTREHVEENLQASDMGPLSRDELTEIEAIYKENVFFVRG